MDKKKKRHIFLAFQKRKRKEKMAAYQARDGDLQRKEEAKPQQESSGNSKETTDPVAEKREKSVNRPDEGFTDRNRSCRIPQNIKFLRRQSAGSARREPSFFIVKFQRRNRRMLLLRGHTKQSREWKKPILL